MGWRLADLPRVSALSSRCVMRWLRLAAKHSLGVFLFVSALASVLALIVACVMEYLADDPQDQ